LTHRINHAEPRADRFMLRMRLEKFHAPADSLRMVNVIRVQNRRKLALRQLSNRAIQCHMRAGILLRQNGDPLIAKLPRGGKRSIRGAIIDDDDLFHRAALREDRIDCRANVTLVVIQRNGYAGALHGFRIWHSDKPSA
jgi:hypothetical protein